MDREVLIEKAKAIIAARACPDFIGFFYDYIDVSVIGDKFFEKISIGEVPEDFEAETGLCLVTPIGFINSILIYIKHVLINFEEYRWLTGVMLWAMSGEIGTKSYAIASESEKLLLCSFLNWLLKTDISEADNIVAAKNVWCG